MKILIVEDNAKMQDMIHNILMHGLGKVGAIHRCRDGQEAVDLYEILKPDWVLMDIRLELMNGLTASRKIKAEHPDAKIIIVTHYADAAYREKAKNIGVCAYVLKESLSDLPILIKSIL
ncbi:MAG: response regulator transcription factor [Calditrichia bacterium]